MILMVLKHNGKPIANKLVPASNILSQALGLMFRTSLPDDHAMLFTLRKPTTIGVHMLFMRFPIDAIFLDADKKIIGTASLMPWTGHKRMKGVKYLIEMNSGTVEKYGLHTGETLSFES